MIFDSFTEVRHLVLLRNDSSGTFILNKEDIKLIEFRDEGVGLVLPKNSCVVGHNVTLCYVKLPFKEEINRFPAPGKLKGSFEVIGRVKAVGPTDTEEKTLSVDIAYTQYDVKKWKEFIKSYILNQKNLNRLKIKL